MDSGKKNSESILNQQELLEQYISKHPELTLKGIFIEMMFLSLIQYPNNRNPFICKNILNIEASSGCTLSIAEAFINLSLPQRRHVTACSISEFAPKLS